MQVLIYKGSSQYGAFDHFGISLKNSLEQRNHQVELFDLNIQNAMETLSFIFTNKKFDLVIGFNAIGCDLKVGNESIYDIINTPFLAIFVDHPVYHFSRLSTPMKNFVASFLDESHVDFLQNTIPQSQNLKFFMPLSGNEFSSEIKTIEEYKTIKKIDILFTGSNFGKINKQWENVEGFPSYLFDEISDKLIKDDYISVENAFNDVMNKYKISFSSIGKAQFSNLLSMVVTFVRQYKRNAILEKIFESGLNITLYGKNWSDIAKKYSNVIDGGEISLDKTVEFTKQSKIVINLNTNFTNGAHDRVFTGMLNQAVVFTDKSSYYDKYYNDKEHYLTYSINSLDEDIKKLKNYLEDEEKLFDMANKAYSITKKEHSWLKRAEHLENMVSLLKNMNS